MKRVINSGSTHPLTIFSHITTTSYSIGTVYTVHYINIIHTVQCTYSDLAKFEIISFFCIRSLIFQTFPYLQMKYIVFASTNTVFNIIKRTLPKILDVKKNLFPQKELGGLEGGVNV